MAPESPQLYDEFPNNISNVAEFGNKVAVDAAFKKASHVTRQRFVINRISTNAMETRGCVGTYDRYEDRYTMYCDTQSPHSSRKQLAQEILNIPETKVEWLPKILAVHLALKTPTSRKTGSVSWPPRTWTGPLSGYASAVRIHRR